MFSLLFAARLLLFEIILTSQLLLDFTSIFLGSYKTGEVGNFFLGWWKSVEEAIRVHHGRGLN